MHENNPSRKRRVLLAAVTFLIFLLFGGICFAAGALIWYQGQEVDVSVDTSGEHFTERVSFSVSNVLGMDILIDEREGSCARLQFYEGGVWLDVCEIRFVREDSAVISVKYGGMYAHLEPGMTLTYCLDEELLAAMSSGEYRVAIPYISEEEYLRYLQKRGEEIDESLEAEKEASLEEDLSEETEDPQEDVSEEPEETEAPEIQIFYEEFVFVSQWDTSAK